MRNPDQIAVVGVTGYTGFELARILVRHPEVESVNLLYAGHARGASVWTNCFRNYAGVEMLPLRTFSVEAIVGSSAGIAFLATPHDVLGRARAGVD